MDEKLLKKSLDLQFCSSLFLLFCLLHSSSSSLFSPSLCVCISLFPLSLPHQLTSFSILLVLPVLIICRLNPIECCSFFHGLRCKIIVIPNFEKMTYFVIPSSIEHSFGETHYGCKISIPLPDFHSVKFL